MARVGDNMIFLSDGGGKASTKTPAKGSSYASGNLRVSGGAAANGIVNGAAQGAVSALLGGADGGSGASREGAAAMTPAGNPRITESGAANGIVNGAAQGAVSALLGTVAQGAGERGSSYTDYTGSAPAGSGERRSGYTGGGYNNGSLTPDQIREMQAWYGTAADGLWGDNSTAAAGGLNADAAWQVYQSMISSGVPGNTGTPSGGSSPSEADILTFDEYRDAVGAEDYMQRVQDAIAAQVAQARQNYEAQMQQQEQRAEEAARQAYIANRLGALNMDQRLAAQGVYGGAADSQRIALQTNYENELAALELQRQEVVSELERAIANAQLLGDQQTAEAMAAYLQQLENQYGAYYQNALATERQAQLQREQMAYQQKLALEQMAAEQQMSQTFSSSYGGGSSAGTSSGGGAYGNGGLSRSQIRQLQKALGVTADGVWGPQSSAAAGGMSAQEAWEALSRYQMQYG